MREMVINAQISIIARYENEVVIKIYDRSSSTTFVELTLTHEQFVNAAMNRLSNCDVKKAIVMSLDRVGKTMEHKPFEFPLPEKTEDWDIDRKIAARKILPSVTPEGWIAEDEFSSQNSFFEKDGKKYARTIIRRYV